VIFDNLHQIFLEFGRARISSIWNFFKTRADDLFDGNRNT